MASITKHKSGWRAQVARQGVRKSKTFPTKQEARDWAARQEHLILSREKIAAAMTLGEVFARYADEVSPTKRGYRWEVIRLAKFQRDKIATVQLRDLSASHFATWRDARLREVAPASVAREMNLMGAVLTRARKEWQIIPHNPLADVRKPSKPPPRNRLPTPDEIERLQHVAGSDLTTATARAFHAFRFACETAMRAGEIVRLRWSDISGNVAHLPKTKNGFPRDVPLSKAALDLLAELPRADPVFDLTSAQLDALFRKVRKAAAIEDLTFHDSRHHAVTQLARRLDVMDLARMVGHRNLGQLLSYYNAAPSDIASRLD
jgi:integrase